LTNNQHLQAWEGIKGGDIVKGEVEEIKGDSFVKVKIGHFIVGRIYKEHLSDIPL